MKALLFLVRRMIVNWIKELKSTQVLQSFI